MSVVLWNSSYIRVSAPLGLGGGGQRGFTLIEVMVTVILLSLGLLGLAGLQALSLKNGSVAYYRGIASQQAYDMGDRIRANQVGVNAGFYDDLSSSIPADPGCFSSGCTSQTMATTDQSQWLSQLAGLLPEGKGTVRCAAGPSATCVVNSNTTVRVFDVSVSWTENSALGSATQTFVTRVSP